MTVRFTAHTRHNLYVEMEDWEEAHHLRDAYVCGRGNIEWTQGADGKVEYSCDIFYHVYPSDHAFSPGWDNL